MINSYCINCAFVFLPYNIEDLNIKTVIMFQFNLICQINKTNLYTLNFAWNNLIIVLTSHYLFNPIYFYQFISQLYQCFLYCYILSMHFFYDQHISLSARPTAKILAVRGLKKSSFGKSFIPVPTVRMYVGCTRT